MEAIQESVTLRSQGDALVGALFLPGWLPGAAVRTPALLVCHGSGEFKEHYFELCECLAARGVAALALDMHGHGGSQGERFCVDMPTWIADVRAAVEFLAAHPRVDGERIGAFGLSSGGTAILEAALVEPRLKALVALEATVRNSLPPMHTVFLKCLVWIGRLKKRFTKRHWRLPMLKLMGDVQLASDPEVQRQLWADPRNLEPYLAYPFPGAADSFFVNTLQRVSRIRIPTLVLWGEDDRLDPPETARMLFHALGGKKALHIIPGNGHVGHLDRNKDKVFELTTDWALENLA